MPGETTRENFEKAVINTAVGQLPNLVQAGGKALLRQMQRDPFNISGISTIVQVVSQSVLPHWAEDAHSLWAKRAERGMQTHSLANDLGIDRISETQSSLATAEGYSKAIFVISNLNAAIGTPKLASALSHLENPSLKATLGDEAYNIAMSMHSAEAIHDQAQETIKKHIETVEGMISPLLDTSTPQEFELLETDVWALSKSPDPTSSIKGSLLLSVMSISRFGTPATPIQYPIVATHISFVVALAIIFGFRLSCQGQIVFEGEGDEPKRIDLVRGGDFKEGEEIIVDVRSLVQHNEKKEGSFEYLTIRDIQLQAKINLSAATSRQITQKIDDIEKAIKAAGPLHCNWQEITGDAIKAVFRTLREMLPKLTKNDEDLEDVDVEDGIRTLLMVEILRRAIAGDVMTLCTLVEDPEESMLLSAVEMLNCEPGEWSETLWRFLHAIAPELRSDIPFSSIVGGQIGVLVPSLLLCSQHAELMGCSSPMTLIPGILTVRSRRQQILNEAMPGITAPLDETEVDKVTKPKCIWRTVQRYIALQGTNLSFRYKIYADQYTIDIGTATQSWLQVIPSSGTAAQEAVFANAGDYICRNVDSSAFRSDLTTVWLTYHSLAGKLLVLSSLGRLNGGDEMDLDDEDDDDDEDNDGNVDMKNTDDGNTHRNQNLYIKIYLTEGENLRDARRKAQSLGCTHLLV